MRQNSPVLNAVEGRQADLRLPWVAHENEEEFDRRENSEEWCILRERVHAHGPCGYAMCGRLRQRIMRPLRSGTRTSARPWMSAYTCVGMRIHT